MKKAFTIVELLLAVSLLTVLLVVSGAVFRMAVTTYRTAAATSGIARKLRAVTDQINTDFKGLRKDGPIFVAWVPLNPADTSGDGIVDSYERFDRIMFFADGDFYSYGDQPPIRGNVARLTYMLAEDGAGRKASQRPPAQRTLARSQHIFTADPALVDPPAPALPRTLWIDPARIPLTFRKAENNRYQYDNLTLSEWFNVPAIGKLRMLTVVSDIAMVSLFPGPPPPPGGLIVDVDAKPPVNVHQLLAEGVGSFSVQGWYEPAARWFPEVNPDGDRDMNGNSNLTDTDFTVDAGNQYQLDMSVRPPRLIYPWPWNLDPTLPANVGVVDFGGTTINNYPRWMIDRDNFNRIPGLGRALKFTFTLYDSRGVFKEGKTFTHIVYLDD